MATEPPTTILAGTSGLVSVACYRCRSMVFPKRHPVLPGLQWTCSCDVPRGVTWGPVTAAHLARWIEWYERLLLGQVSIPYWLNVDREFRVDASAGVLE